LILVRHGESTANAARVYQGWNDDPLSPLGEQQARALARALAARRDNGEIHPLALYASPLQRAWRTGVAIGEALGLTPVAHPGLREIDVGAASGVAFEEVARRWPELLARRPELGLDFAWPGGESGWEFRARVAATLDEIIDQHRGAAPDQAVIVASHGGTIRFAVAYLRGDDPRAWPDGQIANCSLTELAIAAAGDHRVVCLNRCDHLTSAEYGMRSAE
jgi:probable phosphoglycerate mutase